MTARSNAPASRRLRGVASLGLLLAVGLALPVGAASEHEMGHDMTGQNVHTPPPADTGYAGPPVIAKLYGHIFDLLQPVPINTQPMVDLDLARGFGNPSVPGVVGEGLSTMRFYSSPGLVEYNVSTREPRVHPERGVSYDIEVDTAQDILAFWYMSVKPASLPQAGNPADGGPEAGLMPNFAVRVTLRVGDDIGADLDGGEIVAEGETVLAPDAWTVQGPREFVINLGKAARNIPGDEAFNVKVEWYNVDANGARVAQRDWVLHTGSQFPNRVELPVRNPIAVYYVHPQPVGEDRIAIHTLLNSPFGNYDVDVSTVTLEITGPTPAKTVNAPLVVQKSWIHNHHFEPVTMVWTWDWRADGAAPGEYTARVTATNLQGTATATKAYAFRLDGARVFDAATGEEIQALEAPAPKETPALPALALLPLLAFLALLQGGRPR